MNASNNLIAPQTTSAIARKRSGDMNSSSFSTVNPGTGEPIETFPFFTAQETEAALVRAEKSFKSHRKLSVHQRAELLSKLATTLRKNNAHLAKVITMEMGKVLSEAEAEVEKCAWEADWYAEHGPQMLADAPAPTGRVEAYVSYLPLGRKPQRVGPALKMSRPWSACMPSGAKSAPQNGNTRKAAACTEAFRHFRWHFATSRWASCGWTRIGWMMHAGHSTLRGAVCPLTRRRKAISPRSKSSLVKSSPPLPPCTRWRRLRMILITRCSLRGFSPSRAVTANPGTGVGWLRIGMTSFS